MGRLPILLAALALCLFAGPTWAADKDNYEFPAQAIQALELDRVPGAIEIRPATGPTARVRLSGEGDYLDAVTVDLTGQTLRLTGHSMPGSATVVTTGSGSVTNILIGSGTSKVTVNGQTIENTSEPMELTVRLELPPGLALGGRVIDALDSTLAFSRVNLELSGIALASMQQLQARDFHVSVSGNSSLTATGLNQARTAIQASGASQVELQGGFTHITAQLSGASKLTSTGEITGDLDLEASGASQYQHQGPVRGRINKTLSGASAFRLID